MNDKISQILVIAATAGMLVFNWLAATGVLGGVATNVVSAKYPTRITPAGYAFAIWSLIYLGMIVFSIRQAIPRNAERYRKIRPLYLASCVLNCAWLYFWHQEAILVCLALIAALLAVLIALVVRTGNADSYSDHWFVNVPFGIYAGWVTAATLVNAMIALVYVESSVAGTTWLAVSFIFAAAACGIAVRILIASYFYPLAIAWALTAIAVKQSGATAIVVACAVGVIACLIAAVSFVMDKAPERHA
jgi:hypothetical protein